jgi:hypothetical protein
MAFQCRAQVLTLLFGETNDVLRESNRLQFRAEACKLLNRPDFNIPNRTVFTANFGTISSAQDSRQLQLALKLIF